MKDGGHGDDDEDEDDDHFAGESGDKKVFARVPNGWLDDVSIHHWWLQYIEL